MIDPTLDDIGRKVVYRERRRSATSSVVTLNGIELPSARRKVEEGVLTSFNEHYVFVRYSSLGETSAATSREDLEWVDAVTSPAREACPKP